MQLFFHWPKTTKIAVLVLHPIQKMLNIDKIGSQIKSFFCINKRLQCKLTCILQSFLLQPFFYRRKFPNSLLSAMFQPFNCFLLFFVASAGAKEQVFSHDCRNSSINSNLNISRIENINLTLTESQSRASSFNPNLETFMSAVRFTYSFYQNQRSTSIY